jgi:5-(carboxyamino)imidazole ribonucleotide synthase
MNREGNAEINSEASNFIHSQYFHEQKVIGPAIIKSFEWIIRQHAAKIKNLFDTGRYLCAMQKVGILGGGQLGRMLLQSAANYPVETFVMENDEHCPSAHLCHHFIKGNIKDYEDVYQFGKGLDVITIEIEAVNVDALEKLEAEGVTVIPKPSVLRIVKNKIEQKKYYQHHQIPTAEFVVTENKEELKALVSFLPAAHKLGMGGYDGRGVELLKTEADIERGFDAPSVLEKMVKVDKEISMIVAVAHNGEIAMYPPAEMVFDPHLNLLDYQISPAALPEKIFWKLEAIAMAVVRNFNSPGLFAVELFVDKNGDVLVNETAPRVHNSGHHSIEGNYSSQFDMLWRILLKYPLGCTDAILPAVILNIVGEEGFSGPAFYEGLDEVLKMEHAFVHLYGKTETKPGRKMGHVTLIGNDREELIFKANRIKHTLKVKSKK